MKTTARAIFNFYFLFAAAILYSLQKKIFLISGQMKGPVCEKLDF